MSKLWTFSGINSPFDAVTGEYIDYVWEILQPDINGTPDRRYASRLGTSKHYDKAHNVVGLDSEKKLDREAAEFTAKGGGHPVVKRGMFRGKTVKLLLVAPKSTTKPPRASGLQVDVYWSPRDQVPNQGLIRPDSLTYWRKFVRGGGVVWPVENKKGTGFGKGHDFSGFLRKPKILKRVLKRQPGTNIRKYIWKPTGQIAPSPIKTLQTWIDDPSVDYVITAHSQGANIALHLLSRGYKK